MDHPGVIQVKKGSFIIEAQQINGLLVLRRFLNGQEIMRPSDRRLGLVSASAKRNGKSAAKAAT